MHRVAVLVGLVLLMSANASAQEDVTPPVLLDFTIVPEIFDTGTAAILISTCVRAADDLSGLDRAQVLLSSDVLSVVKGVALQFDGGDTVCGQFSILPQFTPYGTFSIRILVADNANNRIILDTDPSPGVSDLCATQFICQVINRPGSALPDSDMDGVPDDADNCPSDFNPLQEDFDLDLIGDICDPFPEDRDNEQAQCDLDLEECLITSPIPDEDGDGEADPTDGCPGTHEPSEVDTAGCSQSQFCAAIGADTVLDIFRCILSDWRNDEPLLRVPRDCWVPWGLWRWGFRSCVSSRVGIPGPYPRPGP